MLVSAWPDRATGGYYLSGKVFVTEVPDWQIRHLRTVNNIPFFIDLPAALHSREQLRRFCKGSTHRNNSVRIKQW